MTISIFCTPAFDLMAQQLRNHGKECAEVWGREDAFKTMSTRYT